MNTQTIKSDSDAVLGDLKDMVPIDDWIAECRPFSEARAVFYKTPAMGVMDILKAPRFDGNTSALYPQNADGSGFAPMISMKHVIGFAPGRPS